MNTSDMPDPASPQPEGRSVERKPWKTALLLAGSAAFGGLAVALWNRKTLTDMRKQSPEVPHRTAGREDDIY
jgi:hypothetical protein